VSVTLPRAMHRLIGFLGELGPRWGLPAEPCRVHGYLYLRGRPATDDELRAALNIDAAALKDAIAWLKDYRLIEIGQGDAWRTGYDPWELMMRVLDERRRREAGPALATLRECRRLALEERGNDPVLRTQIDKLLTLAEDLAAIDAQARRLSPTTLRQVVGIGGRAARFLDRTFGRRDG
jgi:DNA-binding transcriptional regulator GbsR (MarR family)